MELRRKKKLHHECSELQMSRYGLGRDIELREFVITWIYTYVVLQMNRVAVNSRFLRLKIKNII